MADSLKPEESLPFVLSLQGRSIPELMARFGPPTAELGPFREKRWGDGWSEVIAYRRAVEFAGVAPRGYTLRVSERADGRLDVSYVPPPAKPGA